MSDFSDTAAAFRHYAKHTKGIRLLPDGKYKVLNRDTYPDMPEFSNFQDYREAARAFMGGGRSDQVLEGIRRDGALLRLDPKSGYFGIRSSDGVIRTFYRPDGAQEDWLRYFYTKLSN